MKVKVKSFEEMADRLELEMKSNIGKDDLGVQDLANTVALLHASLIALYRLLHERGGI